MKKAIKRVLLFLLVAILLAQIPFVYRRYLNGKLSERIRLEREAASNSPKPTDPNFDEYKGVIHVHTSLGKDSTGRFDELITAADANALDFVVMTEHPSHYYDSSALTLNGIYGKALFVGGSEIRTWDNDRFLVVPGTPDGEMLHRLNTKPALEKLHAENRLAIITYPETFKTWDSDFDGSEVFSLNTNSRSANMLIAAFDLVWSFPAYPSLTLAAHLTRPDANLQHFDEISANRKVPLVAGSCAHSNLGFHLLGDDAGRNFINIKLDPYETIFRLVRMHVLLDRSKPLTTENLIEAVRAGHFYNGFDVLGDTDGFRFFTENSDGVTTMGDEIMLSSGLTLKATSPLPARFVVFKNGEMFHEADGVAEIAVAVTERAAYRVEVYRNDLGSPFDKMPWIMSNPIYVR